SSGSLGATMTPDETEGRSRQGAAAPATCEPTASLALLMRYRGSTRTTELAVSPEVISQLVLEAEFREVKLGDLISRLITAIAERDLFRTVLEPSASAQRSLNGQGPVPS